MGLAEIDSFLGSERAGAPRSGPSTGGLAAIDSFLEQPTASTWRDRMFKTGQETLADPGATWIERLLAGGTVGGREALRGAAEEPDIPKAIGEALAYPVAAAGRGLVESGIASPRTVDELGKLMMALTPIWTAPRPPRPMRGIEPLRAKEAMRGVEPTVRPIPEPSVPPVQPVESPTPPVAKPMPPIPEPISRVLEPKSVRSRVPHEAKLIAGKDVEGANARIETLRANLIDSGFDAYEENGTWVLQRNGADVSNPSTAPPDVLKTFEAIKSAWRHGIEGFPLEPSAPQLPTGIGPEPAMPELIRRAIEPTRPALPAIGVGDLVEYRPRLSEKAITGTVTNVNADGTVNVRARAGGVIRNVAPEKITATREMEPVGLESQKIGKRIALSEADAEILGEMKQTVRDVQTEPTLGKRFTVDRSMESAEAAHSALEVKGYATGKPGWMEIPDRPGQYHEYADVLKAIESLERGQWPGTARRQRIAEQLLQEVRFDAEQEKARVAGYRAGAEEAAPSVGTEQAARDAFFGEVDRLAAEEAAKTGAVPETVGQISPPEIPPQIAAALPRPAEAARANIAQPEMFTGREMIGPAVRQEKIAPRVPQAAVGDELLAALKPTVETQAGLPVGEAWSKGDAVRYTPKPDQPGFAGRIIKVNKDGTVDIQAAAGGTVRNVDPASGRISRLLGAKPAPQGVTLGSVGGALQEAAGYLPESLRNLPAAYRRQVQKGIDALVAKMPKVFREARGLGEEYVDIVHDRGATLANYVERGVELGGRMHHGLTEAERGRVDQVMRGGRTVNPAIQGITDPARSLANELQGKLIEQGYLTPEQVQLFQERFRSHPEYLRRLYETKLVPPDQPFLSGELTGPVGRGVKSEALMMRGDIQEVKLPPMGGEPLVGAQRADFLQPWLKKGYRLIKAEGDTVTLFRDIPEPIRRAMGEIRDKPGFVFAKTIAEQARIVANHEFLAKIAENPEWAKAGLTDTELASGEWTRLTGDKKKWGPLADYFVKKDVALEVQNSIRIRQDWEKVVGRLVGLWKYGKVIVNPAAMGRNIISSSILADFGGLHQWMLDEWAKGANQIRKGDGVWPEAKKLGLFRSGFAQNEILALSEGIAKSTQPNGMLRMLDAVHEIAEAGRQKTGFSPSRIYAAIENFYRFNLYRYARETLDQPPKDARRYALKYAIDYEVVSPFVAGLRGTGAGWAAPLAALGGAPFATFASKAIPLTLETLALHPIRVLKYPAIVYGMSKIAGPMIGQSEEETVAQRALGGLNWLRYALIPRRDKDERSQYYDLGYTFPFGDLIEAFDAAFGGKGRRANISFLPLVGHPVAGIFEAVLNRSGFTGKDISEPSDTALQSLQKRVGHIYQSWAPSLAPPLPGLPKGGYGYEDLRRAFSTPPETDFMGRTRSPVAAVLASLGGMRAQGVTTAELANFKAKQYEDMLDSLDSEALKIATKYRLNPAEANRRMEELKQRAIEIATEAKSLFSLVPRGASRPTVPAPIQQAIGGRR